MYTIGRKFEDFLEFQGQFKDFPGRFKDFQGLFNDFQGLFNDSLGPQANLIIFKNIPGLDYINT